MDLGNFTQAGAQRIALGVEHATALDEKREMRVAVLVLNPSVAIAVVLKGKWTHRSELITEVLVELCQNPIGSAIVDGVLEARMLAVGAITEVTLHEHDFFRHIDHLFGGAKSDDVRNPRISRIVAVRRSHATAHGDIESDQFSLLHNRDEGQAVGVNVDIV